MRTPSNCKFCPILLLKQEHRLARDIQRMFSQIRQGGVFQRRFMRRFQNHQGSLSRQPRLLPTSRAKTPTISLLQTRKMIFRPWRGEIIPHRPTEPQKPLRHLGANRVAPEIFPMSFATPGPGETGHRIHRTGFEIPPQNIFLPAASFDHAFDSAPTPKRGQRDIFYTTINQ